MAGARIGVVTFGTSATSRTAEDLHASLRGAVVDEIAILDGVSVDVMAGWRVEERSSEATVVHLADGSEVTLRTGPLLELAERAAGVLVEASADIVLYGCAGPLPYWPSSALTLRPQRLLQGFLDGALEHAHVGMVVPSSLHVASTVDGYSNGSRTVSCIAASPVDRQAVADAVDVLVAEGADLVVLTCFDHTLDDLRSVRKRAAVPVTSSRRIAVAGLEAILGGASDP